MEYKTQQPDLSGARMIEGANGLKIYVSVEKPENYGPRINDDFLEDVDLANLDEDVSVPGMPGVRGDTADAAAGVVGALANADDDGMKPKMECPTCGLVLYRHNFSTHFRIHTGEMPFQCQYCDKRFRTTSAVKVHTRAHTGEKPHICPTCKYACITRRNLDRHIENNHMRDGVRRGPRYRRSRYRPYGGQHEHGNEFPDENAEDDEETNTAYESAPLALIETNEHQEDHMQQQYIVMADGEHLDLAALEGTDTNIDVQQTGADSFDQNRHVSK